MLLKSKTENFLKQIKKKEKKKGETVERVGEDVLEQDKTQ